ncbi:MAG: hypothetical protein ACR2PT_08125 [Endozoicomonas sp.]
MSKIINSTLLCLALLLSSALAFAAKPSARSSFGVDLDITDSDFCQKARYDRETAMSQEPDLSKIDAVNTQDAALCFSPDENLYFVAVQEAQNIIGPHALWYIKIGGETRGRAEEACKVMGYVNDKVSRAYDHCVENRYEELMGPYEDKYRREAGEYIRKRRTMAESLVVRCDAALSIKRSRLPKDIRFPLAYYDKRISSMPSWFLEEKLGDEKWLGRMGQLKANEVMREVLGEECPGSMVFWVTYTAPKV